MKEKLLMAMAVLGTLPAFWGVVIGQGQVNSLKQELSVAGMKASLDPCQDGNSEKCSSQCVKIGQGGGCCYNRVEAPIKGLYLVNYLGALAPDIACGSSYTASDCIPVCLCCGKYDKCGDQGCECDDTKCPTDRGAGREDNTCKCTTKLCEAFCKQKENDAGGTYCCYTQKDGYGNDPDPNKSCDCCTDDECTDGDHVGICDDDDPLIDNLKNQRLGRGFNSSFLGRSVP